MKVQQIVNLNFRNGKWNQYIFIYNQLTNRNSMKISNFRIKDRLLHKNKLDPLFAQNQDLQEKDNMNPNSQPKFDIFMEKFQQFMNVHLTKNSEKTQKQDTKLSKFIFQADYRDRYVLIDLPEFRNNKVQPQGLQAWIGQLSREVLSVAFNYYSTGKFTYDQAKVYASESFLRNVCRLVNRYDISNEQLKFIDKKMQREIFPYLKTKYPMTSEKDSNKSLQKAIKEINNIEALTNDFFYYTDLEFEFRENGKYDDLIMRLINEIMKKVNQKSTKADDKSQITNYKDFENFMVKIFQKTYDETWMNSKIGQENDSKKATEKILQKVSQASINQKKFIKKQSLIIDQNQIEQYENNIKNQVEKQKYKLQVQQYTDFKIGRKISENTQFFSQDEIKSGFLIIKSPAILRILTKWCEQLWEKFSNENYFLERAEGVKLQKGNQINVVYYWFKNLLKSQMKAEKQNIQNFLKEIEQINYSQQIFLLKSELQSASALHMDKMERVTGKFSCKIVKNLENFTILYLNRLIHGLTTVSKNCFKQLSKRSGWPHPPNLISFKIGDLMRCKFSSKQREVLKVFQQIQRINDQEPQKMKIIRIKNRLNLGTNDVLLNVRFNNLITCQIQLAVSSTKTSFINCSYNFSHYVYQLQRSFFGPISELCSIWKNLQMRSKQFSKLIQKQTPKKQIQLMQNKTCPAFNRSHILIEHDLPFICYECGKAYSQNNYMISHLKCSKCIYCKCAVCQIIQNKQSKNKKFFLTDETLNLNSSFSNQKTIPEFGVCIFIKRKPLQPIIFTKFKYKERDYLFKKKSEQNKMQLMKQIGTTKQLKTFINQCVLFSISQQFCKNYLNIDRYLAIRQFLIPSQINQCFKNQKQSISLLEVNLLTVNLAIMQKITKQQKKCIKYIQFSSTELSNMDLIQQDYINLNCLNLNINKISNISKIQKFPKLQKLYLNYNLIEEIPTEINILTKLKQLDFQKNKIKRLPQSIIQLKQLKSLKINNNMIQNLPQKFYQLQNLRLLIANHNKFTEFPLSLTKHQKIQFINLAFNQMTTMPEQIQKLENLKQLILNNNSLNKLPNKMDKMKKLQKTNLFSNKFQQFSQSIILWKGLVELNLASNLIKELNFLQEMQNLKNFTHINLQQNLIQSINDSLQNLKFIQIVKLSKNKIATLSQQCFYLKQLTQIQLSNNKIQKLNAKSFSKCKKLKKIILQNNQINQFPDQFKNLKTLNQFSILGNKFIQFPTSFIKITNLKIIVLKNFQFKFIPENIGKIKALKQLNLSINVIETIPDSICELQQLRVLNLCQNKIVQINSCIFQLTNLEDLNFTSNLITDLPNKFETLKKLKKLQIESNKIRELPSSLSNIQNLTLKFKNNSIQSYLSKLIPIKNQNQANVRGYKIKYIIGNEVQKKKQSITKFILMQNLFEHLPQILFDFPNLQKVYLQNNLLKELPKQISKLKNLTTLDLNKNPIQSLVEQIGDMPKLTTLYLKCENFKLFPKSIQKLNLKYISLRGDKLHQIKNLNYVHAELVDLSNQGLEKLSQNLGDLINADKIDFGGNYLQSIPESIGNLVQLTQLDLSNQQNLELLPQSLGNLINLKMLNVSQNKLNLIPSTIGNLINLQKLQISNNKIKQLPPSISNLTNLQQIIMKNNQFEQFPSCLINLPKLKNLNCGNNKIKQIPIELFTQVIEEISLLGNKITKIPKQIEKMQNLKVGKLFLGKNPIQKIEAFNFMIQKGDSITIGIANQWKINIKKQNSL